MRTNAEYSLATRRRLLRVASQLFGRHGFAAVPAERIVRAARLTRGALYHHFDGKEGLFAAVLEERMRTLHARLARRGKGASTPLDALRAGFHAYLRACTDPAFRQVVLVDGPSVLGWQRWRELDLTLGLGLLRGTLAAAMERGQLAREPAEVVAQLLAGALIDGAMVVAQDRRKVRQVEAALWRLVTRGLAAAEKG